MHVQRQRRNPEHHAIQDAAERDTGTQMGVLSGVIGVGGLLLMMLAVISRGSPNPLALGFCALLVIVVGVAVAWWAERLWRRRNPSGH